MCDTETIHSGERYRGTQLWDLHIMNLKSCSVSRPLFVKTACVYEERVSSQFHGIT